MTPGKAITFCQKALNIKEEPRLYCQMADAYIADEMFDEGESHVTSSMYCTILYVSFYIATYEEFCESEYVAFKCNDVVNKHPCICVFS